MRKNIIISVLLAISVVSVGTLVIRAVTQTAETTVRINAQKLDDGRVEFALEQRNEEGAWGERILPRGRYFPANARVNRWLRSTPIVLSTEVEVEIESSDAASLPTGVAGTTRGSPVALRTAARAGDWRIQVLSTTPHATSAVAEENRFNDPPQTGWQFYIVEVEVTYLGEGSQSPWLHVDFGGLGSGNAVRSNSCGVIPNDLDDFTELFTGGSIRGNICFPAPSAEVSAGGMVLLVDGSTGGSRIDQDRAYLALE